MADTPIPHVEDDEDEPAGPSRDEPVVDVARSTGRTTRRSKALKIGQDVLLISAGVFFGLMGDQWRERAQHRELAEAALRRFRAEIVANRQAVAAVKDYHIATQASIQKRFSAAPDARRTVDVQIRGLQPVFFARTAWDVALATQSLAYIDAQLAFAISRIYTLQQDYADTTRAMMSAMYLRPPTENVDEFLGAVSVYYGDIVLWEPRLLALYDELIPQLDGALGDTRGN